MAHFAKLDENNIVIDVALVNNDVINNVTGLEEETTGIAFCQSLFGADTKWKQTSFNGNFRGNYGGIGMYYDSELDAFYNPVAPYESWILNKTTFKWEAPVSLPDNEKIYVWNEELKVWEESQELFAKKYNAYIDSTKQA